VNELGFVVNHKIAALATSLRFACLPSNGERRGKRGPACRTSIFVFHHPRQDAGRERGEGESAGLFDLVGYQLVKVFSLAEKRGRREGKMIGRAE